jgi:hypothetical protein
MTADVTMDPGAMSATPAEQGFQTGKASDAAEIQHLRLVPTRSVSNNSLQDARRFRVA